MRLLTCLTAFGLVGLVMAASSPNDEADKKVATGGYYPEELVKYKATNHDIVKLVVPLNALNLEEVFDSSLGSNKLIMNNGILLFFVEADVLPDSSRVDQGLYVLKEGKTTKILDYGRDAAASRDNSTKAFFGAKDGIYVYNPETNSADKYGTITDSIIAIDMDRFGTVIYILTEDRDVYKVTDNGEKKEKLDDIVKPKQMVLDYQNNLYFFSVDKVPYVRTADGVKRIEGLPEATGTVTLFKPPRILENGAPVIINNKVHIMYPNGTSRATIFEFNPKALPTALAPEALQVQYYAYDKKIYEYNQLVIFIMYNALMKGLDSYLENKSS